MAGIAIGVFGYASGRCAAEPSAQDYERCWGCGWNVEVDVCSDGLHDLTLVRRDMDDLEGVADEGRRTKEHKH